ncbi:class I SAM-dependent methyltransferase [Actinomadura macrotermitis]|nr:class I SAM-dependent methyltransferase [Actinomadura macrotermitis]
MIIFVCGLVACGMAAGALRLRRRLAALTVLTTPQDGPPPAGDDYTLILAAGVRVPGPVRDAAAAHARAHGLAVLDLVPADLRTEEALDLARAVDPRAYRRQRTGLGRGAGHALLVHRDVRRRLDLPATTGLGPGEFAEATVRARQYTARADLAVAGVPARRDLTGRRTWLTASSLMVPPELTVPKTITVSVAGYALVALCLVLDPLWGLLPLAAYSAAPRVATAKIRPYDRHRAAWLRALDTPLTWWRTLRAPRTSWERHRDELRRKSRRWHLDRMNGDLFEERRETCPWCGSSDLRRHLVTRDTVMAKPGRFVLERCGGCGHVFQNPRLNPQGLAFYYKDVYDGLAAGGTEHIFSAQTRWYRDRAELVQRHCEPRTWLDVGAGHGHFCATAAEVLPRTRFDGLDLSAGIEEAARRGWVRRAVRGEFQAIAADVAGGYDVVSMNHYLEHTADPLGELDAAVTALAPGGHLLIELPDPECALGRLLRGFWIAWLPPQHLSMIPMGNLTEALRRRGLEIVEAGRRGVRDEPDLTTGAVLLANALGPDPRRPWATARPGPAAARRALAYAAVAPLLVLAVLADLLRPNTSNAYRVLAKLPDDPA